MSTAGLRALHDGAALVDRSDRGRLSLAGPKAAELFTGLVTNDVKSLAPGQGSYGAALTAKGKIVADVRVYAGAPAADRLLVDAPARAADGLLAMVRKFINPRLAPYRDERATLAHLAVFGPASRAVVAAALAMDAAALDAVPPLAHVAATVDGEPITLARTNELRADGWDLWVPATTADAVRARLTSAGAVPASADDLEVARIESGRPEWGLDMDETTIPQEANFDELGGISYEKGCYIGQETVARVHFRGHVNRQLRHLRFEGEAPAPRGAELVDESGKVVGDVRSGAVSPFMGAIAIAMVRREVAAGARVLARWDGVERAATVASLPYVEAPAGA